MSHTPYDTEQQALEDSDSLTPNERTRLSVLRYQRAGYLRAVADYQPLVAAGRAAHELLSLTDFSDTSEPTIAWIEWLARVARQLRDALAAAGEDRPEPEPHEWTQVIRGDALA